MRTIVLVDGNALMHRAYHAVKFAPTYEGKPVGMVYGFASMLLNTIEHLHPDCLVVAFDTKEKTFRHEMDVEYKAHREKADDEFYAQIPWVYECIEQFEIPILAIPGYEADDIIGTLAQKAEKSGEEVKIMSGDLDFLQLVSDKVVLVKPNGKVEDSILYGPAETEARLGVTPNQVIDYKAIVGDSSDNYKGIPGCGPKTASALLNQYGSLDGIYAHLEELNPKLQQKFEDNKDYVFHCQKLAAIETAVPVDFSSEESFHFVPEKTNAFFQKFGFPSLLSRYQKMIKNYDQKGLKEQDSYSEKEDKKEQLSLF